MTIDDSLGHPWIKVDVLFQLFISFHSLIYSLLNSEKHLKR